MWFFIIAVTYAFLYTAALGRAMFLIFSWAGRFQAKRGPGAVVGIIAVLVVYPIGCFAGLGGLYLLLLLFSP